MFDEPGEPAPSLLAGVLVRGIRREETRVSRRDEPKRLRVPRRRDPQRRAQVQRGTLDRLGQDSPSQRPAKRQGPFERRVEGVVRVVAPPVAGFPPRSYSPDCVGRLDAQAGECSTGTRAGSSKYQTRSTNARDHSSSESSA